MSLDRKFLIHVTRDGTIYYRERGTGVFAKPSLVVGNGWRDVAADALREGKVDKAQTIIDKHRYEPDEEPEDPGEMGLPVMSTDTLDEAKELIRAFGQCVRPEEELPDGQLRFVLDHSYRPTGVEDLWKLGERLSAWYDDRFKRQGRSYTARRIGATDEQFAIGVEADGVIADQRKAAVKQRDRENQREYKSRSVYARKLKQIRKVKAKR